MNLREFGSWAINQGSVANPSPNYKYKGQCVSLIQQYLFNVFNIPFKAHGNAKDWEYNVPNGFIKLNKNKKLQRGDIIVYGANYGGGYGHIGLIDANWKFLDQNGVRRLAVGYRDTPFINYRCILRPANGVDCGDVFNSYNVKVTADVLNVREGAGTNYRNKSYNELTENAKAQVLQKCGYKANGYCKNVICTISEQKGNWGKTPSGWICLDYTQRI